MARGHFPTVTRLWRVIRWLSRPRVLIPILVLAVVIWLSTPYLAYRWAMHRIWVISDRAAAQTALPEYPRYVMRMWRWGLDNSPMARRALLGVYQDNPTESVGFAALSEAIGRLPANERGQALFSVLCTVFSEDSVADLTPAERRTLCAVSPAWIIRLQEFDVRLASDFAEQVIRVLPAESSSNLTLHWAVLPPDAIAPTVALRLASPLQINGLEYLTDGRGVVAVTPGWLYLWAISGEPTETAITARTSWGVAHRASPEMIATSHRDGVDIVSLPGGEVSQTIAMADFYGPNILEFTPNGAALISRTPSATGSALSGLTIWDLESGQPIYTLRSILGEVACLETDPDRPEVFIGLENGNLLIWEPTSDNPPDVIATGYNQSIASLALLGNSKELVVCMSSWVGVLDLETRQFVRTVSSDAPRYYQVVMLPDGTHGLVGNMTSQIQLWNMETGELAATFIGPDSSSTHIALSPDGTRFAASSDHTDRIAIYDIPEMVSQPSSPESN